MSRADDHFERDEWLESHSPKFYKIMIVDFNTGGSNLIPVQQASARRAPSVETNEGNTDSSVSFSSQALQDTLKQSAAVRPEKVAQATALVNDSKYPSDAALNQLAGFLANRL